MCATEYSSRTDCLTSSNGQSNFSSPPFYRVLWHTAAKSSLKSRHRLTRENRQRRPTRNLECESLLSLSQRNARLPRASAASRLLVSPLAGRDGRCRRRTAIRQHISNRNSRFTEFRSTRCKHTPYRFSNRNKNAYFALFDSTSATHESHAATREPRTTTRAAFRSTIPRGQNAYR
jgi:hypothetical protein